MKYKTNLTLVDAMCKGHTQCMLASDIQHFKRTLLMTHAMSDSSQVTWSCSRQTPCLKATKAKEFCTSAGQFKAGRPT